MKKGRYDKEFFSKQVADSVSFADVATKIGVVAKGSNYKTIQKYIKLYGLDTSHFLGQGWRKDLGYSEKSARIPLNDILKENTNFRSDTLKRRLVKEGIKEWKCEKCGITDWMGEDITLELHHINGNHFDNRLENLQMLCPNCHSQTPTHKKIINRNTQSIFQHILRTLKKDIKKYALYVEKNLLPIEREDNFVQENVIINHSLMNKNKKFLKILYKNK